MSTLRKAENAHELYQHLLTTLKLQRLAGVGMGKVLMQLKANNLYQEAIGTDQTWHDFLKMPEIGLEPREANRAMELYETFCLRYGYTLEELSTAKTKSLHYLLPLAKSDALPEDRIRGLVDDAKHLSQNQFRENLYEAKTGDRGLRTYEFVLMRKCVETGTLQRVPEVENELIIKVFNHAGIPIQEKLVSMPEIL